MASLMQKMRMYPEAEAAYKDAFDHGIKVGGPQCDTVVASLQRLYGLYRKQHRTRDARQLRNKAAQLGCDVSGLV